MEMSKQGYSFVPSIDFIRQASGLPTVSTTQPLMLGYRSAAPSPAPVTTPVIPQTPITPPVVPSPVVDAAAEVAGASKPVVPQFVTPYAKPSGPGAFGESDVNPFYTNKKMF